MGFIAVVFTYLSAVTVLVVALLMSFDAFLYPPGQSTSSQQTIAAAAKPSMSQPPPTTAASNAPPASPVVTEAAADDPHTGSANAVSQGPRVRRLVRQARARSWAFQQESNALGNAGEPSASFLYDRFQ
jgi:hypothetical protein